ncbi:MAG: hypothetical protein KGZ63_07210 [Clostridiales bacterium]|nr:hypothetical protein [Clostridiales bacterium]
MQILVLVQGIYGHRIADNIRDKGPADWEVRIFEVPAISEQVIDEPELYLPEKILPADLILHLAESQQAAQLIPAVAQASGAKAVIASIDSSVWIPVGLRNQLRRELSKKGITIVFPEPLCSLDESSVGYGETLQPYTNDIISSFARCFGKPILEAEIDEAGKITDVKVKRGSPCGSTEYTVGRVRGMDAEKAVPTAGLMCLHYPCLASMRFEQTDAGVDTIMHNSGRIFNEGMENALKNKKQTSAREGRG